MPLRDINRREFAALGCTGAVVLATAALAACAASEPALEPVDPIHDVTSLLDFNLEDRPQPTPDELLLRRVSETLDNLSLEQKVAQLFIVRPEKLVAASFAQQFNDYASEAVLARPVGGLILFDVNLVNAQQTQRLLSDAFQCGLDANGIPMFLSVDEEGGEVARIGGSFGFDVANVGSMASIGATGDPELARDVAVEIASYLQPLGFNLDFAPVCDIANNPYSSVMSWRAFGDTPDLVAAMVAAQVRGFLAAGMLCCAKHFPGIGGVLGDSHDGFICSYQTIEEMQAVELVPFKAAIDAGVPCVMVGHLSTPSVTGNDIPASFCPEIVQGLLRESMGYEGLIITDSLEMGAISNYYDAAESSVMALAAGCDIVLLPLDYQVAFDSVLAAVSDGILSENRINQSVFRILRTKLSYL